MEVLETERLIIRPFTSDDLHSIHQLLDLELKSSDFGTASPYTLVERERWLQWTILGYDNLAKLNQPPYGERAIIEKDSKCFVGICGFVPYLDRFKQLCDFKTINTPNICETTTTEFGLFYAVAEAYQNKGIASEATLAMIDYAFKQLHVYRVIATTSYNNVSSIKVMTKLGMCLQKNPFAEPSWLQVVGTLDNPAFG